MMSKWSIESENRNRDWEVFVDKELSDHPTRRVTATHTSGFSHSELVAWKTWESHASGASWLPGFMERAIRYLTYQNEDKTLHNCEKVGAISRTPEQYAIEHAEYMAVNAESLLKCLNRVSELQLRLEEESGFDDLEDEATTLALEQAQLQLSEASSSLRSGIYEFRKRAERCHKTQQNQEEVSLVIIEEMVP